VRLFYACETGWSREVIIGTDSPALDDFALPHFSGEWRTLRLPPDFRQLRATSA
jgi:hypothetical protein